MFSDLKCPHESTSHAIDCVDPAILLNPKWKDKHSKSGNYTVLIFHFGLWHIAGSTKTDGMRCGFISRNNQARSSGEQNNYSKIVTHKVPWFLEMCYSLWALPSHSLATPIVTSWAASSTEKCTATLNETETGLFWTNSGKTRRGWKSSQQALYVLYVTRCSKPH